MIKLAVAFDARSMLADLRRIERSIVPRATARALNKQGASAETRAFRAAASEADVPVSRVRWHYRAGGTRTKRRRVTRQRAKPDDPIVRLRVLPAQSADEARVPYGALGVVRATKRGARAGRHQVLGGFEHRGNIFKRVGREAYPIAFQSKPLQPALDNAFASAIRATRRVFLDEFNRLLKLEFAKRARRST